VFPVPVLTLPELSTGTPPRALAQVDAVRLFLDRAVQSMPSFVLDEQTSAPVVDICRRLDGIPLAIELAAARMRTLSVATIADRLSDRFRLLTTGSRTALPRQQTLRALIDWSLELLTANERVLFARLAVFAGGFTLDAAETVCEGAGVEREEILDLLSELVEKSLLVVEGEGSRYRLLETMREYARERLVASGEMEVMRSRHLDYYLALAESAAPALTGEHRADALRRFDADRENLIGTHVACASSPEGASKAYRLVVASKLYWFMRGLLYLGHRMTEVALAIPANEPASPLRCRALWVAGQISSYSGRYEEATAYLREALSIAEHHGDQRMVASIENVLSLAALGLGDREAARGHCQQALAIARALGSEREIAVASNALAQLHRLDGDLEAAGPLYEEVVSIGGRLRDQEFVAIGLLGLAMVAVGRRDADRARQRLREALAIASATGSTPAQQSAVDVGAGLAALLQDYERCASLFGVAEAQTMRAGIRRDPADEAFIGPWIEEARRELGARFEKVEGEGRATSFESAITALDDWLLSKASSRD
jgi:tetratricopeptide (TPR) repeat protein